LQSRVQTTAPPAAIPAATATAAAAAASTADEMMAVTQTVVVAPLAAAKLTTSTANRTTSPRLQSLHATRQMLLKANNVSAVGSARAYSRLTLCRRRDQSKIALSHEDEQLDDSGLKSY